MNGVRGERFMNILFCNIAWMKYYEGITEEDKPRDGGSYVTENGNAYESNNFKNYNGKCYGYVRVDGSINLQKYYCDATKNTPYLDDVLIVWCAKSEHQGTVIIGWYKHARVYRDEQNLYINGEDLYYRFEANADDCILLPEEERIYPIGRAKKVGKGKGFGQSNVWYANAEIAQKEVVPEVIKYIEEFEARHTELEDGYDEISDEVPYYEGSFKTVKVNRYERNPEARKKCIEKHGCQCKICGFDFEKTYGEAGKGLIHVHHVVPISSIKEQYQIDYEKDLIPVCPNCHAMIHRKATPYTIKEIKNMLEIKE